MTMELHHIGTLKMSTVSIDQDRVGKTKITAGKLSKNIVTDVNWSTDEVHRNIDM